jgi:hypothetical protein
MVAGIRGYLPVAGIDIAHEVAKAISRSHQASGILSEGG